MPENPKKERAAEEKNKQITQTGEKSSNSKDQSEKSYYYDDAHGYEIYDPNEDEDDDIEEIVDVKPSDKSKKRD